MESHLSETAQCISEFTQHDAEQGCTYHDDETLPLLGDKPAAAAGVTSLVNAPYLFQILVLCYTRLMEPIAFFCIFPYVAEMVQRNGRLQPSDIGFYSGIMESAFCVTQIAFLVLWGNLAEKVGRKPVLIISLVGMSIGQVLFGLSSSLWEMLLFRSLTGVFSSANLIIRTMIGEICSPETQPQAFTWYSTSGNIALFLGPLIGGVLVEQTKKTHSDSIKNMTLFGTFPYAKPGFLVAAIGISAAVVAALFLKETLVTHDYQSDNDADDNEVDEAARASYPTLHQLLKAPNVLPALVAYGHVMFLAYAYVAILPVALYTSPKLGGFGYSTSESAVYVALQGASETIWLFFAFPLFHSRLNTLGVIRVCAVGFPCLFGTHILLNGLLRDGGHPAMVLAQLATWTLEFLAPGIWMSFTAAQLRLNEVSPSQHALGKMNSVAEILSSLLRSLSPPVFSILFAIGVRSQIFYGYFAWVILIALSMPLLVIWKRVMRDRTLEF